jgi:hypothetical protein
MNVIVEEPQTSWGLVSILIQPLSNLAITQTLIVQVLNDIVQFYLVVGVWCGIGESC